MGDRECPTCREDNLVEQSQKKWVCLKCNEVFDERFLDDYEELVED